MGYPLLYRFIKEAEDKRVAIGHFNFSDIATVKGIMGAVDNISRDFHFNIPVCLGTSEGELSHIDPRLAVLITKQYKNSGKQVFLNADHIHSLSKLKEIVEAGYDSAVFDASNLPFEQNIDLTREAVKLAKSINPDFLIEGEINYIQGSSKILEDPFINDDSFVKNLTSPEQAALFVSSTQVDLIAPSVGNIHGILKNSSNPRIDITRIKAIKKAVSVPMVLHGVSGLRSEDFIQSIYAGISVIHINTEVRLAWRKGVENALAADKNEVAPYKIVLSAEKAVLNTVYERLKLFNKLI